MFFRLIYKKNIYIIYRINYKSKCVSLNVKSKHYFVILTVCAITMFSLYIYKCSSYLDI